MVLNYILIVEHKLLFLKVPRYELLNVDDSDTNTWFVENRCVMPNTNNETFEVNRKGTEKQ